MATFQTATSQLVTVLMKNRSIVVPVLIIAVLATIVLPLPAFLIDILIAINLTVTILVLLISMYTDNPSNFSIFPTLIIVMTLYRLALNIASTRLILSEGGEKGLQAAGTIIDSFGSIVIAGNYIIGTIIFMLIVIVQFVVISHGAVRIGEVSARFTLDALPGKQMAIDADLNAGFIDEHQARERREELSDQASFFGAMDGASRFTKKDSIASMMITMINIIGGLLIGVLSYGMELSEAAVVFTTLTIGDGLVSAIPSLIITVAAALMTARSSSKDNLGEEFAAQFMFDYRPLMIASFTMLLFAIALAPARMVFLSIALILAYLAYRKFSTDMKEEAAQVVQQSEEKEALPAAPERVESLLPLDALGLEVGYNLIPLVDVQQGGNILDRIKGIRRQVALELGLVVPPIRIRDNLQLEPNEYSIILRGGEISRGSLVVNNYLAMSPGDIEVPVPGIATRDPAFGLPAVWIPMEEKEQAQIKGYTVVDTATVISTHLTETIKAHAYRLLGRQDVQSLLDLTAETAPKLVEDLVPRVVSLGDIQKVLQNLLRERVSIRDMQSILEVIGDYAPSTKDFTLMTEFVRMSLSNQIVRPFLSKTNELSVLSFNPALEAEIGTAVQTSEAGSYLALDPQTVQAVLEKLRNAVDSAMFPVQPVLLTTAEIRPHIARLAERFLQGLVVISHAEIPPNVSIVSLGIVG